MHTGIYIVYWWKTLWKYTFTLSVNPGCINLYFSSLMYQVYSNNKELLLPFPLVTNY